MIIGELFISVGAEALLRGGFLVSSLVGKAEETAGTCDLFFRVRAQLVENWGDSRHCAWTRVPDSCCGTGGCAEWWLMGRCGGVCFVRSGLKMYLLLLVSTPPGSPERGNCTEGGIQGSFSFCTGYK